MPGTVNTSNISFSDIYNVINNTVHNGTDEISFNSFRSSIVDAEARKASLPSNQDYKFNYSEGTNKTISNYNNLIVTNVGSPVEIPNLNLERPQNMNVWPTANDIEGDGSVVASDPTHAWLPIPDANSNSSDYDWMSGNTGDASHRYTFSFMLLHNSAKSTLNIHWKRWSDEVGGDNFYIYELATNSGDNYKNPGAPGIYYPPNSDGFTLSGDNGGEQASGIRTTTAEYIALYYYKQTPDAGVGDDRTYIRIRGAETGLVPYNFVDTTPIILNGDISLNSVTKGKMYAPITSIKFGNYSPDNVSLPAWNSSAADGNISFDAGVGNTWDIDVGAYVFPYYSGGDGLNGQLKLSSKQNESDNFSPVSIAGLAKTYGQRFSGIDNWPTPGDVFPSYNGFPSYYILEPFTNAYGTLPSGSRVLSINARYIKFDYDNNVEGINYASGNPHDFTGWTFTLQRRSGGSDYTGAYTGTLSYPSINIDSDFRTRIKNHNPILKITEAVGIDSSGNTSTNKDNETINLHLDVSGSRPPRISTDKLYDLSLNDITASNNTLDISSAFSGMNGTSSFILASIGRVGHNPQTITVDVSANTFRNEYGNWNDVSGNDYGKFTWNFSDTTEPTMIITAAEGTSGFTSNDGTLSLTFTSNESITDFLGGDITVTNGTIGTLTTVSSTVYTAIFTPTVSGNPSSTCTINVAANKFKDLAGNNNTASGVFNWTRDTVRPTMIIRAAEGPSGFTSNDGTLSLTFTSSKETANFSAGSITLTNSSPPPIFELTKVSSTVYTAIFSPDGDGECTINVAENAFTDDFGNNNIASNVFRWISDRAAPTCTSITLAPGETTSPGDKIIYFDFTESPQNFPTFSGNIADLNLASAAKDLTVNGTDGQAFGITNLNYITSTRLSALVPLPKPGSYAILIPAGTYTDLAGNLNTVSPTLTVKISSAPTTIEIIKGTSSIRYAPLYGLYDYSQFGIIYTKDEIFNAGIEADIELTTGGNISSLFFQYTGWYTNYTAINQTVKFSHTNATQIERGPFGSGSSYVNPDYRHIITSNETTVKKDFTFTNPANEDWEEIGENTRGQTTGFSSPFKWNGKDNILISWENRDDTWVSGYGYLRGGGDSRRAHSWYSDNSYPTSSSGNNVSAPNIRLVITPA